jgi:hypothetical protein
MRGIRAQREHNRRRRLVLLVFSAFAVAASSATPTIAAGAPTSPRYRLAGFETRATSVTGSFVGTALGSGGSGILWQAVVQHRPLTRNPAGPAQIRGGTVTLRLWSGRRFSTTTTALIGGTITYARESSSKLACGRRSTTSTQHFPPARPRTLQATEDRSRSRSPTIASRSSAAASPTPPACKAASRSSRSSAKSRSADRAAIEKRWKKNPEPVAPSSTVWGNIGATRRTETDRGRGWSWQRKGRFFLPRRDRTRPGQ